MKLRVAKLWPVLCHFGMTAVVFLNPSVQSYGASHKGIAVPIMVIWGMLLAAADSPIPRQPRPGETPAPTSKSN